MPRSNFQYDAFLGGEWSPWSQGRVDQPFYPQAMNVCLNGFPLEQGAWIRRPGFIDLGYAHKGWTGGIVRYFSFFGVFPDNFIVAGNVFAFELSATDSGGGSSALRVWVTELNSLPVLLCGTSHPITVVSSANPAAITLGTAAADWATGDTILITGDPAATTVNVANFSGRQFIVTKVDTTHFTLVDAATGLGFPGSLISALYASGNASAAKIVVLPAPYASVAEAASVRVAVTDGKILFFSRHTTPWIFTMSADFSVTFADANFKYADGPYLDAEIGSSQTGNRPGSVTTSDNITYHFTAGGSGYQFVAGDVGRCFRIWTQPAAWAAGTYAAGATVTYNYQFWTCLYNSTTAIPGQAQASSGVQVFPWQLTSTLGRWLACYISAFTDATHIDAHIIPQELGTVAQLNVDIWQIGAFTASAYPICGGWHEGRLWLGGAYPGRLDISKAAAFGGFLSGNGTFFSPSDSQGIVDDDAAIAVNVTARDSSQIQWFDTDRQGMLFGTADGEWLVASADNAAITPTDITAKRVSRFRSAFIDPIRIGAALIFVEIGLRMVYEYLVDAFSNRFAGLPLNEKALHIPEMYGGLSELAYRDAPEPMIFGTTTSGNLVGCTYRRISDFATVPPVFNACHRHEHGGGRAFTSITDTFIEYGIDTFLTRTTDAAGYGHIEVMSPLWGPPPQ